MLDEKLSTQAQKVWPELLGWAHATNPQLHAILCDVQRVVVANDSIYLLFAHVAHANACNTWLERLSAAYNTLLATETVEPLKLITTPPRGVWPDPASFCPRCGHYELSESLEDGQRLEPPIWSCPRCGSGFTASFLCVAPAP